MRSGIKFNKNILLFGEVTKMKKKITIVIADDNVEFATLLGNQLNKELDISVLGIAHDGIEAINLIEDKEPDMVILDLIMPNLDGIGVLERAKTIEFENKPVFIILSAMFQDSFVKKALALGAQYYIIKPFNTTVLISRIRQINAESEDQKIEINRSKQSIIDKNISNIENEVTELIHAAGIQTHLAGFRFLRDAIIFSVNDKVLLNSITNKLYPLVAQKHNIDANRVERSIRSAIENAWKNGDHKNEKRMTNTEFICEMVYRIERE
jgi:two-component system response regulator (stage 0 sporulation protein A)